MAIMRNSDKQFWTLGTKDDPKSARCRLRKTNMTVLDFQFSEYNTFQTFIKFGALFMNKIIVIYNQRKEEKT